MSERDALDDWRLGDQERYLQGAALVWKRYRARSESWDHDHCKLCWAKLMDPELSEAHRRWVADSADILVEGYTTIPRRVGLQRRSSSYSRVSREVR